MPLVKAIALRVHETLPVQVELDDLVHAGALGLFEAVGRYVPERNVAFPSYARHRIKGAILDSLRQLDWASRDIRRRRRRLEAVTRELTSRLQRDPTESEIAQGMGVDIQRWRQMMSEMQVVGPVPISSRRPDQDDVPVPDYPANPDTRPDSMCARQELHAHLWGAMNVLPERYRKVVVLYYTGEMTMREIGGVMGINESRVSQIHKSALGKMAVALQAAGIHSIGAF